MKRNGIFMALVLLAVMLTATVATAHNLTLVAAVSLHEGELTLRALDPYEAAMEGASAEATVKAPGGKEGRPVKLTEGPGGTYRGILPLAGGQPQEVRVDLVMGAERFRVVVQAAPGESFGERLMPMMAIEEAAFSWGPYLYGAAVIVLLTATGVALARRRRGGAEEEEE